MNLAVGDNLSIFCILIYINIMKIYEISYYEKKDIYLDYEIIIS